MRTSRTTYRQDTTFILTDVDPVYHDAVRSLHYEPMDEGFGKTFPSDTSGLEQAYRNFQRCAEAMVLQTAGAQPVPWAQCLEAFLEIVEPHAVDWWLCGSAALAVRGIQVEPRDVDLVVAEADAKRLGEILSDHVIEPVLRVETWFCDWFARAFLHARLEWVGGVDEQVDRPEVSDFGPTAQSRLETVAWRGRDIQVPPLNLQLGVSKRRGLTEQVARIERFLRTQT